MGKSVVDTMVKRKVLAEKFKNLSNPDDAITLLRNLRNSGYRVFWHQEANRLVLSRAREPLAGSPKSTSEMKKVTQLLHLKSSEDWKELQKEL